MILIQTIKSSISLIRPKNWLKNVFIFIPIVFSLELFNQDVLIDTAIVFAAFCLIASSVYSFNDICDVKKDSEHPVKRARPIPSGLLTKQQAAVIAAALLVVGFGIGLYINYLVGVLFAAYIALNLLYSLWLKRIPIIDCFCIAAGFVLRVYIGGVASNELISEWLFLTVVTMSLFMAFGKRHGEPDNSNDTSSSSASRIQYDKSFLQGMIYTCAGLTIVFYSLWAMNRGLYMTYTVPLILYLVAKYLLLVHSGKSYGDPTTIIFEDKSFLVVAGLYAILTIWLLYLN